MLAVPIPWWTSQHSECVHWLEIYTIHNSKSRHRLGPTTSIQTQLWFRWAQLIVMILLANPVPPVLTSHKLQLFQEFFLFFSFIFCFQLQLMVRTITSDIKISLSLWLSCRFSVTMLGPEITIITQFVLGKGQNVLQLRKIGFSRF